MLKITSKLAKIGQNTHQKVKNAKKHIFWQNACYDIFQTVIDIDLIFFGGRNTYYGPTLN